MTTERGFGENYSLQDYDDELKSVIIQCKDLIRDLNGQNKDQSIRAQELIETNESVENEEKIFQEELEQLLIRLEKMKVNLQEKVKTISFENDIVNKNLIEIESVQVGKTALKKKANDLLNELQKKEDKVNSLLLEMVSLFDRISNIKNKIILNQGSFEEMSIKMIDLKQEASFLKSQTIHLEQNVEVLEKDIDNLMRVNIYLLSDTVAAKKECPSDSNKPVISIVKDILNRGIDMCSLEELSQFEELITDASSKLKGPEKFENKNLAKRLPNTSKFYKDKIDILMKTCSIQSEVAKRQLEGEKITSALTKSIEQFKGKLLKLKLWYNEQGLDKAASSLEEKVKKQLMKIQYYITENQVIQCICAAQKEKQRSLELESNLQLAMDNVKNIQKAVISDVRNNSENELKHLKQISKCKNMRFAEQKESSSIRFRRSGIEQAEHEDEDQTNWFQLDELDTPTNDVMNR